VENRLQAAMVKVTESDYLLKQDVPAILIVRSFHIMVIG